MFDDISSTFKQEIYSHPQAADKIETPSSNGFWDILLKSLKNPNVFEQINGIRSKVN